LKVAVLGAGGSMGAFFARYFVKKGYKVIGSDASKVERSLAGMTLAGSNSDAVRGADLVLLAVPIRMTANVLREVSPNLKRGSTVVEMTSIKGKMLTELKRICSLSKVSLLSIHPMFGPLSTSRNLKICVVGTARDQAHARQVFPGAKTILLGAEEHDKLMAYTLSLVHMLNLAFASAVAEGVGVGEFTKIATPFALAQLNLSEAILSQEPHLLSFIQTENPFVTGLLSSVISQLEGFRGLAERRDATGFEKQFSALAAKFDRADLVEAMQRVYSQSA
jgi:prephenate dehydrogenase